MYIYLTYFSYSNQVESAYHLYLATKSESYLAFGSHYLSLLQKVNRVKCGYAATADVHTKRLDDRMDSYFLAETLKYLYLLFDEVGANKLAWFRC